MNAMKKAVVACGSLMLLAAQAAAGSPAPETPEAPVAPQIAEEYERVMAAAETERQAAMEAVERARVEMARSSEEVERAAAEQAKARQALSEQQALEQREVEQMRRELSRAQEELRRASREVVRVHRELERQRFPGSAPVPPAGNRAVIGVVLGKSDARGVEVLGVSPGGPAERAGIRQGDVITGIMGRPLAGGDEATASSVLLEVMDSVKPGDELDITVQRDDGATELTLGVVAEAREPVGWTHLIRLPSMPDAPGAPRIIEERIEIPSIDSEALAEKMAELQEELGRRRVFITEQAKHLEHVAPEVWEFEFENLSELGGDAMHTASVWFGMPLTRGLKLAELNAGLGAYFKTDRGVLVLNADEDNALQLESGDVLLEVGGKAVDRPVDVMRELRGLEPGTPLQLEIMRRRKSRTLEIEVPERTSEFGFAPAPGHDYEFSYRILTD